ncbi:phosphoenolpyruvate carboxykinase (ATP) [Candidatus Xianfuyuplasma coldseepsis]|uniref:phosphoenolpyruvate carboxykinase (ATP) n=1 Tax=Candidatus Xianfuyuplasma coldseepsis TaxID=2782163 RepID=A0A7L7KNU6_9MOLU|nr:phosphoenolpyruvate carboxykinase (ATP) [Xianfuyuplasma coldseepsis]QMS84195.1 phosphoenolpyruvate carboxykinase (ATP) [Xianfuyuplasma coldseepsis]
MATKSNLSKDEIGKSNPHLFHRIRTTIETAFYRNNVVRITSLVQAYELAKNAPGTIISDLPVHRASELGLPEDAKVLLFNDGIITGRQAKVRKLINLHNMEDYANLLRNAVFESNHKRMYHATTYVGLHPDFMVKAHLLIPEGYENTLYSWMLNFQHQTYEFDTMYKSSTLINEGDVFLYSDPDFYPPGFQDGLSLFDHTHNVGALFGMRYFGEHKKATLTMSWSVASRFNYTACHGGQKRFVLPNDKTFVAGVFGLSGSGKSTITHASHGGKYDITVLHDDAFIISNEDGSSISLEPAYFDKVQDYPTNSPDNKFLLTMQNVGATIDQNNHVVPVTEDIRNGNGRALKSRFWTPKRVFKFDSKVNAIFWIMKDETLPPILRVNSSVLASTLGATLATKRSSAEHGAVTTKLVIEPYANPFRLYPLRNDYLKFKDLFENHNVTCYVINTGFFLDSNITPSITLNLIEQIVEGTLEFAPFGGLEELSYTIIKGYNPDFTNNEYLNLFKERMQSRIHFIEHLYSHDILPSEAKKSLQNIIDKL